MSNISVTEIKQHIKIDGTDQILQPAEESFQVLLTDGEINVRVQSDEDVNHPITVQEQTQTVAVVEERVSVIKINEGSQGLYGEIYLTPKPSSTGPRGTVFFDSDDDHLWAATEL
jgi:hypothetical protein